jgi:serine protease
MSFVNLARWSSRRCRLAVAAIAAVCGIAFATPLLAGGPNVTEIVVRFRDIAHDADPAAAPTAGQFDTIGRSLRTGIAAWTPTLDGGFRVSLAPSMPFLAAREAVNRLRMDAAVLYASIGATDAPPPANIVHEKKGGASEPPLHRLIIRYRDTRLAADAAADRPLSAPQLDTLATIAGQPVAHERAMAWARAQLVRLFQPLPRDQVEAIAQRVAQQPDVLWAQPDYIDNVHFTPNDPLYNSMSGVQWHYFEAVGGANLPAAWDRTKGWSGLRIAVIDTGALFGHPDLAGRFVGGYDFVAAFSVINPNDGDNRDPDASDPGDWTTIGQCSPGHMAQNSSWHGTHVAGTIGAASNNGIGVAGINFVSRIVPVRVLGMCGGFTSDITDGMVWASGGAVTGVPANPNPARVINMSIGGFRPNQTCDMAYQTAANAANANGALVVVSAGNDSVDASFATPANCNGVVTVASIGRAGQRASYSNHDLNDASGIQVEIAAPGGSMSDVELGVLSTLNNGATVPAGFNYVQYQGTSMAAPHVTGIASLMLSLKPTLTPAQVLSIMTSTARAFPTGTGRDCTSNLASAIGVVRYCGAGIIDAAAALTNIMTTGGPGGTALAADTATLASSLNPAGNGQSVTFTATITGINPTGTVNFTDNDVTLSGCGAVPLAGAGNSRTAQCTTSSLPPGVHPILASYGGNASNTPADSNVVLQQINVVGPQTTTTAVASSLNPSPPGASVTFTATVTNQVSPAATGSVNFTSDAAAIEGCTNVALAPGAGIQSTAACTTNALAAGNHTIVASYGGNASNLASVSPGLVQAVTLPTACAGFNDLNAADPFCQNAQWIVNRLITLGCTPGNYCPATTVSRLSMAAFMNREGTALTPEDLVVPFGDFSPNLATPQVLCSTADSPVTSFPRRAYLRARANLYGVDSITRFSVEHVFSTNGGSSWNPVPNSMMFQTLFVDALVNDDKTLVPFGAMDLAVGTTYRFGVRVARVEGTANPGFYCANFVQVRNRNAASPPL